MRIGPVLVAAALLAGCAERAGIGADPGPDSPVTSTPMPGPSATPTPLLVTPRPGLLDVRPHTWHRAERLGPRTVRIDFWGGVEECEGLARVRTEYAEDAVTITLFVGRVPGVEVCIEIAVLKSVTVELEGPLQGRKIVDGSAGN